MSDRLQVISVKAISHYGDFHADPHGAHHGAPHGAPHGDGWGYVGRPMGLPMGRPMGRPMGILPKIPIEIPMGMERSRSVFRGAPHGDNGQFRPFCPVFRDNLPVIKVFNDAEHDASLKFIIYGAYLPLIGHFRV